MSIIRNAARCDECGDIVESEHRHDFKWCSCRAIAVDGGKSYIKRSWREGSRYTDLSEFTEDHDHE